FVRHFGSANNSRLSTIPSSFAPPSETSLQTAIKLMEAEQHALISRNSDFISSAKDLLSKWLRLNDSEVTEAASLAADELFLFLSDLEREDAISEWISIISTRTDPYVPDKGFLSALLLIYPKMNT